VGIIDENRSSRKFCQVRSKRAAKLLRPLRAAAVKGMIFARFPEKLDDSGITILK